MGTAAVVEGEVAADPGRRVRDGVVGVQVDLFVLEGASFCEDVCGGLTRQLQRSLAGVVEILAGVLLRLVRKS